MNYTGFISLSVVVLFLIYTGFQLFNAIYRNYQSAAQLRGAFAQRIQLLPMFNMLQQRKIDLGELLYRLPVTEIENSVRRCESCHQAGECRTSLRRKENHEFHFCANNQVFVQVEKAYHQAALFTRQQ